MSFFEVNISKDGKTYYLKETSDKPKSPDGSPDGAALATLKKIEYTLENNLEYSSGG